LAGPERVGGEPAAAGSVVAACDGLPLAMSIVGARMAARPAWSLGHLARLLADERLRLDELGCGRVSVRASLESAYRDVMRGNARAADVFRLLGRRSSATVTVAEAAGRLGWAAADAQATLEALADANLLMSPAPGRYLLPALARLFAAECAGLKTQDRSLLRPVSQAAGIR
jgi:hypothetical protein